MSIECMQHSPKGPTHLYALAVIEEHVAQLFGDHVQMSLLPFMGPGQNVELWEVRRKIVERSENEPDKTIK